MPLSGNSNVILDRTIAENLIADRVDIDISDIIIDPLPIPDFVVTHVTGQHECPPGNSLTTWTFN